MWVKSIRSKLRNQQKPWNSRQYCAPDMSPAGGGAGGWTVPTHGVKHSTIIRIIPHTFFCKQPAKRLCLFMAQLFASSAFVFSHGIHVLFPPPWSPASGGQLFALFSASSVPPLAIAIRANGVITLNNYVGIITTNFHRFIYRNYSADFFLWNIFVGLQLPCNLFLEECIFLLTRDK